MSMSDVTAQTPDPIRYTLRFPAPHTHYLEVEAVYPTGGRPEVDLMMAVWTPGSYLVREYERHVEGLSAKAPDGRSLSATKPAKNRWRVSTGGAPAVTVTYRVYGREMTVRNNWVDAGFAMLNGAPTFITLADRTPRPHEVRIELPAAWLGSNTALLPIAGQPHAYRAEDFDTLVDSPIVLGNPVTRRFDVDGKAHHLVLEGDPSLVDADRVAADLKKIVEAGKAAMGPFEYPHYYFLNMVVETGGGLEHKNSFLTMSNRFVTRTRQPYINWLSLAAHEYFHNWNIKRLRPVELGPFDYETENYTKSLWVAEGVTDYYGSLLVRRAGLTTTPEYLDMLSNSIEAVQTRPGRRVQSAEMASFDTWIKQYRPDENSPNTSIDYYDKGATIAFLLDATIRQATGGAKSLDDAMRLAYQRHSGAQGLHARGVPAGDERGGGERPVGVVRAGAHHHRGTRLQPGARLLRPALRAGRSEGTAGDHRPRHPQRRRPAGRVAGAAQHAGLRRRHERRRRDPGHRRPAGARRRPRRTDGSVPRRRHRARVGSPSRPPADAADHPRRRAGPAVAAAGEAGCHDGAAAASHDVAGSCFAAVRRGRRRRVAANRCDLALVGQTFRSAPLRLLTRA